MRAWFDDAAEAAIPDHDGTLDAARRAYCAGVRALVQPARPALPARAADVARARSA